MPKYINGYKVTDYRQGGMAVVYKGMNSNGFMRAFKVVRPDKATNNPALCQKFLKGIQILQQLDHPNIVRALNAFTYTDDENGSTYTVLEMDWLDGIDLEQLVKQQFPNGMTPDGVRRFAVEVCQAMSYAHSRKILHLDIKPSNLMLTNTGYIKVIDFGIAKIMGENANMVEGGDTISTQTHTGESSFRGTLAYSSPEQFNGSIVTERSDIYSFGCTLNFLLTGTNDPSVRVKDPHFATIIDRCRQHNPNDRYQTFEDVRKAIEQEDTTRCINCSRVIPAQVKFCPHCGAKQEKEEVTDSSVKICPECRQHVLEVDRFCSNCGHDFNKPLVSKKKAWVCGRCGHRLPEEFNDQYNHFCYYCGSSDIHFMEVSIDEKM